MSNAELTKEADGHWVAIDIGQLRDNFRREIRVESPDCGTVEGTLMVIEYTRDTGVVTVRIKTPSGLIAIPTTGATLLVRK